MIYSQHELADMRAKIYEIRTEARALIRELLERNDPEEVERLIEYAEGQLTNYYEKDITESS